MIRIRELNLGTLKLDGGAMFGVVPKSMWQTNYPADEDNLTTLAMRSLLLVDGDRVILIDTGAGDKQAEKFKKIYHLDTEAHTLLQAINEKGFMSEQITDVILTHLHFDHCGGATYFDREVEKFLPVFEKATYHIGKSQWENATNPNPLERASFMPDNFLPLMEAGLLNLIEEETKISDNITVRLVHGHTPGQLLPFITYREKTLVYMADLIPIMSHIPLPWICAYDVQPLLSVREKEAFLKEALVKHYTLFSEHDLYHTCCQLEQTEKGIRAAAFFSLDSFLKP